MVSWTIGHLRDDYPGRGACVAWACRGGERRLLSELHGVSAQPSARLSFCCTPLFQVSRRLKRTLADG